jgi:hypothetical protein
VLDEDEGHADAGGHGVDEPAAGIEPTRRSAYSDDREIRRVQGNAAGLTHYCSAFMVFSRRRRQWTASSMFMPHRVVSDRVAVGTPGNRAAVTLLGSAFCYSSRRHRTKPSSDALTVTLSRLCGQRGA